MADLILSDSELQSAAQAARVAREQALTDAAKQTSPTIRQAFVRSAGVYDALVEKFEQARQSGANAEKSAVTRRPRTPTIVR